MRTSESKPVYAQAWSNQEWVELGPYMHLGNEVKILVEIMAPPFPGQTVQALIRVQGNGMQQFVVPVLVTVAVEGQPASAVQRARTSLPPPLIPQDEEWEEGSSGGSWWRRWTEWFFKKRRRE